MATTKVKDYSKVCWCCGKGTMVSKGNYYQCSECGATWNEVTAPIGEIIVAKRDPSLSERGVTLVKTSSPSHRESGRAKKAREAKGG